MCQWAKDIGAYNGLMEGVAKINGVSLIDAVLDFTEERHEELFITSIHLNAAGHKIIAKGIYNALLKYNLLPGKGKD